MRKVQQLKDFSDVTFGTRYQFHTMMLKDVPNLVRLGSIVFFDLIACETWARDIRSIMASRRVGSLCRHVCRSSSRHCGSSKHGSLCPLVLIILCIIYDVMFYAILPIFAQDRSCLHQLIKAGIVSLSIPYFAMVTDLVFWTDRDVRRILLFFTSMFFVASGGCHDGSPRRVVCRRL